MNPMNVGEVPYWAWWQMTEQVARAQPQTPLKLVDQEGDDGEQEPELPPLRGGRHSR